METPPTETQKFRAMYAKIEKKTPSPFAAIVAVLLIGVAGVVTIAVLRPDLDPLAVSAVIFTFLTPTTLSLLSYLKAQETHLAVNSRLDQFIKNASKAAEAVGKETGRKESEARTDTLARDKINTPAILVTPVMVQGAQVVRDPSPPAIEEVTGTKIKGTIEGTIEQDKSS